MCKSVGASTAPPQLDPNPRVLGCNYTRFAIWVAGLVLVATDLICIKNFGFVGENSLNTKDMIFDFDAYGIIYF